MKSQLKSPYLWLLLQRCVVVVRKPKMKEKELSRVLHLINKCILLLQREKKKNLQTYRERTAIICYSVFLFVCLLLFCCCCSKTKLDKFYTEVNCKKNVYEKLVSGTHQVSVNSTNTLKNCLFKLKFVCYFFLQVTDNTVFQV